MAADGVYLIYARAGLEHDIGRVDLILKRDALDGATHQSRGAAAYYYYKKIVLVCGVNELYYLSARTQALLVGQGMTADINVGAAEYVGVLLYFNDRNAVCQVVAEDFVNGHSHVIARLTCAEQINIALCAEIPAARADAQDIALHMGNAFDTLVSIKVLKRFFGYVQNDLSAFDVAVRQQHISILDLYLHVSFLQQVL